MKSQKIVKFLTIHPEGDMNPRTKSLSSMIIMFYGNISAKRGLTVEKDLRGSDRMWTDNATVCICSTEINKTPDWTTSKDEKQIKGIYMNVVTAGNWHFQLESSLSCHISEIG